VSSARPRTPWLGQRRTSSPHHNQINRRRHLLALSQDSVRHASLRAASINTRQYMYCVIPDQLSLELSQSVSTAQCHRPTASLVHCSVEI